MKQHPSRRPSSAGQLAVITLVCLASLAPGCPRLPHLPDLPDLVARARLALRAGNTLGLFGVTRDLYRQAGAQFDRTLVVRLHGPRTLSSFYLEDSNRIVLARAAPPGRSPLQLEALASALFYDPGHLPQAPSDPRARLRLVNYTVLLLAAHEQAHYLRAQYFNPRQEQDHYFSEEVCNRLAVAAVRKLARSDPELARGLAAARAFYVRLLDDAPPAVTDYPPPGRRAAEWFNRHYSLLLRHEPGVYFVFQLRWWSRFLARPAEDLGRLVEREILRAGRRYLQEVQRRTLRTRLSTLRSLPQRLPGEVLAVSPEGDVLLDEDGRLIRIGRGTRRLYRARGLPYAEGYHFNYATWPGGARLYAFRWERGRVSVYRIGLDDARGETRTSLLGRWRLPHRVTTISHDPAGALYLLSRSKTTWFIHRLDPGNAPPSLFRTLPVRPPGHADGPLSRATFTLGSFAVTKLGTVAFLDPDAYALREIDRWGRVWTLAGSLRGHRDGEGVSARLARGSHLGAARAGLVFIEETGDRLTVRRFQARPEWGRR